MGLNGELAALENIKKNGEELARLAKEAARRDESREDPLLKQLTAIKSSVFGNFRPIDALVVQSADTSPHIPIFDPR